MNKVSCRIAGLTAAVLTLAAIMWTLFANPSISAVKTGAYTNIMQQINLTEEVNVPDGEVSERFICGNYDPSNVLKTGQRSIVYPALVTRIICNIAGMPFDTRVLACVYAVIIALAAYLTVSGLFRKSSAAGVFAAAVYPVLMLHPGITGYLNSLYSMGSEIAFTLLFTGVMIHSLCLPGRGGKLKPVVVAMCAALMLCASAQMTALCVYALTGFVCVFFHSMPKDRRKAVHITASLAAALMCFVYVSAANSAEPDINSDAANYMSVFQGYLTVSEHPEEDIEALGLAPEMKGDIGKSYYEPDESFVISPRGADNAFMQDIILSKRFSFILARPGMVIKMIENADAQLRDVYNGLLVDADGKILNDRMSAYVVLETVFGKGGYTNLLWRLGFAAAAALLLIITGSSRGGRLMNLCLFVFFVSCAFIIPLDAVLTGGQYISRVKVVSQLTGWLAVAFAAGGVFEAGSRVFIWLSDKDAKLSALKGEAEAGERAMGKPVGITVSKPAVMWITGLLSVAVCCMLLLPERHIGGVNNGDYGRMMEQIDINWTDDIMYDIAAQSGTTIIEDYTYREPFHPERLTPLDPTYSLIFASLPVRLVSAVTGEGFSTRLMAFVLLVATIASLPILIKELYRLFGGLALLPALLLGCMLFGENYVAWYNSLFGESSISVGLIATIACGARLCMMEKSSKAKWIWLILLGVSVRFMCCAKAQMALALPFGLLLIAVLAVYHRPKGLVKLMAWGCLAVIICGLVSWDTIGVYRKNQGVSEKQTVWQSVFYGALMISDDPDATMEELGIPAEMKADIGKHAYYDDSEYVYAPMSREAEEKFYDHINTMTMVGYYLRHPVYLLRMLNRAAQESVTLHTRLMCYTGDEYSDTTRLYRFNLWANIRSLFACRAFWQIFVLYAAEVFFAFRYILDKKREAGRRLMMFMGVCVLGIGALQFPLSVIGNGYADNNKQMYCFMLTYDLMIVTAVTLLVYKLRNHVRKGMEA